MANKRKHDQGESTIDEDEEQTSQQTTTGESPDALQGNFFDHSPIYQSIVQLIDWHFLVFQLKAMDSTPTAKQPNCSKVPKIHLNG